MILAWYIVAGLVMTATWTQFDAIGLRALWPVVIAFAVERWPGFWHQSLDESGLWRSVRVRPFPGRPTARSVALGVALCLPLLLHLAVTLGEEFPYGGDEGYHFSASRTFARHLVNAGPWLAALALALTALRVIHRRHLATAAILALLALSVRFEPEMTFARYPAGFYFLAAPLQMLAEVLGVSNPHVASHVVNTLSVPVWLFLLRPVIVRRWPDLPAAVAGLVLVFQPTVVTYFGGGGLEPWSLILLLLALETAVSLPAGDRWIAVLIAGCASWIKEPAILILPLIWTLAMVDWRGGTPRVRHGAIPLGIAAATPFITYYFVRHTLALPRFYAVVSPEELLSATRAYEWLDHIRLQFGNTGLVLLAALVILSIAGLALYRRHADLLRVHVLTILAAVGLIVFFYIDVQGVPYTGYGRYLMFPYVLVAFMAAVAARHLIDAGRGRAVAAMAVFALLCQAQPLARTLALDLSPDYTRNGLEWYRCLIRLPFRQLARQIPGQSGGGAIENLRLVTIALDAQITEVSYPDVARRYRITPVDRPPEQTDCRCVTPSEAVIAGFEYRANFDGRTPPDPTVFAAERACIAQVERTCTTSLLERDPAGTVVGVLGVGVRPARRSPGEGGSRE